MSTAKAPVTKTPAKVATTTVTRKKPASVTPIGKTQTRQGFGGSIGNIAAAASVAATAGSKMRGYEGQMYYTPSTQGAVETLFANVVEFDLDVKADSIDASDKATGAWKDKLTGKLEWSGTVKINAIQNGVDLLSFYAAMNGGQNMGGSFRPQDIANGLAYTGTFQIMGWKHGAPQNGLQTVDLNIEGRGALVLGQVATAGQ